MTTSLEISKQHIQEYPAKHLEGFLELNSFIEKVSEKIKKQVEAMEAAKLEEFKDELHKNKVDFDDMNERRKDKAIQKEVYNRKKQLEKECANFLYRSIEVNKIYEGLKMKLSNMESSQEELKHEIQYLNKQIKSAQQKNERLKKQFNIMERDKKLKARSSVLKPRQQNIQFEPIGEPETRQSEIQANKKAVQLRLKQKIQTTKQILESLNFEKSYIEELLSIYKPQAYPDQKKRVVLIERILENEEVKRNLYYILFGNNFK